jgi:glycosyltransferase involved in cell wall biosynthesis
LKPKLFVWSPIILGRLVAGDRVNEVARIKELSEAFDVDAYFISGTKTSSEQSLILSFWFQKKMDEVHLMPNANPIYGFRLAWTFFLSLVVCLEILVVHARRRIDLVICRISSTFPVLLFCRIIGIKTLYNVLSVPFSYKEGRTLGGVAFQIPLVRNMMRIIDYACLMLADNIAVSNPEVITEIKAEIEFVGLDKIVLMPYPVPGYFFDEIPSMVPKNKLILGFMGNISNSYEFEPLIEAVGALRSTGLDLELRLYSSGEERKRLEKIVQTKQINNVFFGDANFPRPLIPQQLAKLSAVVLPFRNTVTSGIPIKGIEAMAFGLPVLVSNPTDPTVFVDGETCICIEENTKERWISGILRLTNQKILERIGAGARRLAERYKPGNNNSVIKLVISRSEAKS